MWDRKWYKAILWLQKNRLTHFIVQHWRNQTQWASKRNTKASKVWKPKRHSVKGSLCSLWEDILIRRERSSLTDWFFFSAHDKLNKQTCFYKWKNEPTFMDNAISYCFMLFVFLRAQLVYSFMETNTYFWIYVFASLILWILKCWVCWVWISSQTIQFPF